MASSVPKPNVNVQDKQHVHYKYMYEELYAWQVCSCYSNTLRLLFRMKAILSQMAAEVEHRARCLIILYIRGTEHNWTQRLRSVAQYFPSYSVCSHKQ